jgi:hypothetical protein|tara:strand:- start:68 stop:355 length:288 start_codon:yes stop_codon:yes gene_type:complete
LEFYNRFLKIYSQVATSWIRKTIRKPLLTIYADTDQKLSFDDDALSLTLLDKEGEREKRFMLLRVRIKGLLTELEINTNVDSMPVPLIIFLNNIC